MLSFQLTARASIFSDLGGFLNSGNLLGKIFNANNKANILGGLTSNGILGGTIDSTDPNSDNSQYSPSPEGDNSSPENNIMNQKVIYEVQDGDTISSIAKDFGVSVNTILWANKLSSGSVIRPGDKLVILPIDGVIYTVKDGDTLSAIADKFKGDPDKIVEFNNLLSADNLVPGQEIIIPDGEMPITLKPRSNNNSNSSPIRRSSYCYGNIPDDNYFTMPTSGHDWGRRHDCDGVDISNVCGTPIRAAADGQVIYESFTPSTWRWANGGYGDNIRILHPNGITTLYGHLLYGSAQVDFGDYVKQGQIIAYMGGKPGFAGAGNSTGCHLHFEVRGGNNPFAWY